MNRGELIQTGWERHSIIEGVSELGGIIKSNSPLIIKQQLEKDNSLIIITTYDCAVIHPNFEEEPWVQLLIATLVERKEKMYSEGRNVRRLHFSINTGSSNLFYEASAAGFYQIERELLFEHEPSELYKLDEESRRILKVWVAERFRQDTWSDEFNEFLRPSEKKLKQYWNRYSNFVTGIYINSQIIEESYAIKVIVVIEDRGLRPLLNEIRMKRKNSDLSMDEMYGILSNELKIAFGDQVNFIVDTTNLSGVAIEIKAESSLSLSDIRNYGRWSPYAYSGYEDPYPVDTIKI